MTYPASRVSPPPPDVALQLVEACTDGLVAVDLTRRCLSWSPSMARITGIPEAAAIGQPLLTLIPDLASEELEAALAGTAASRSDQAVTVPAAKRRLWLDVRYSPLHREGRIGGAILLVADVTERKRIDAQMRETERRFTTMADAAPVLLWLARTDSLCTFFNQTWLDFTGRTLAQEWGVGWAENIHPEDVQRCLDTYQACFAARQVFEMEYRLKRADGVYRWILDRGTPRYGPDGEFAGYIGSCIDISDRKQMETDLRQAIRTRDEFLSIASHELRTPLSTLSLHTEGLQRSLKNQPQETWDAERLQHRLAIVQDQAVRLEQIVESLLDVSRVSQGRLPMRIETVDLTAVAQDVVHRLTDDAAQVGTVLSFQADGPLPGQWDPMRLDQVVTNLVVNAIKYGRGKPVDVRVTSEGRQARLSVRDHGIGIAPEDHERIFSQFERAVSEDHYGGFGIGLWIARQIVDAFGGTITVASQPGEGACFTVTLEMRP